MGIHQAPRSYVLRTGRITLAQRRAIDNLWTRYGVDSDFLDAKTLFGKASHLTLEIGFGDGQTLAQVALAQPERQFLGIEVHDPGLGRLLQKVYQENLNNVRLVKADAIDVLSNRLADHSLDELWVYFPDPWPKKRHHKRRLVNAVFVGLIVKKLKLGGIARFATDWAPYAEQMLTTLNAEAYLSNLDPNQRYSERPGHRPLTKFELRGKRLGHEVRDLAYQRVG